MMCGRAECRRVSRPPSTWEPPLLLQEPPFSQCLYKLQKTTRSSFKQAWQNFSLSHSLYLLPSLSLSIYGPYLLLSPLSSLLPPLSLSFYLSIALSSLLSPLSTLQSLLSLAICEKFTAPGRDSKTRNGGRANFEDPTAAYDGDDGSRGQGHVQLS